MVDCMTVDALRVRLHDGPCDGAIVDAEDWANGIVIGPHRYSLFRRFRQPDADGVLALFVYALTDESLREPT